MFLLLHRRSFLRRHSRLLLTLFCCLGMIDLLLVLNRYKLLQHNLAEKTVEVHSDLPASVRTDTVLIAAQFWTSAPALVGHWCDDLVNLVGVLGADKVFVSIYESGSLDQTKDVLTELDRVLGGMGVGRRVVLDPTTHEDVISAPNGGKREEEGWIRTPRSGASKVFRRIPYLAGIRNKVLEPLWDGSADGLGAAAFDKVLWINDVHFTPKDVLTLLATRGGYYAAACAMDYMLAGTGRYYDTFVLRDENGATTASETFPYFRSATARRSMEKGESVRVASCWNGMAVFDAASFAAGLEGLKFRGVDDSLAELHVEASECCLVHADLHAKGLDARGVWVNPAVRVGYSKAAYEAVHEQSGLGWMTPNEYVFGIYHNRYARWRASGGQLARTMARRVKAWKTEGQKWGESRDEPAQMCLVDQMQVLIWNGWAHL